MSNITVSVVMPVFNTAPYVRNAIQSVLNQSFTDFELIVVDDGSGDDSHEICSQLANSDPRITIVTHDQNRGLGAARNTGLELAKGSFVYFIDSDDIIKSDALENLCRIANNTKADFVHCSAFYKRNELEQGVFTDVVRCSFDLTHCVSSLPVDKNERLRNFFCKNGAKSMTWLNFFRRDFFVNNNIHFPNILFEDVGFFAAALALADNVTVTHKALYVYSRRNNSLTNPRGNREDFRSKIESSVTEGLRYLDDVFEHIPNSVLSDSIKSDCKNNFALRLRRYGSIL